MSNKCVLQTIIISDNYFNLKQFIQKINGYVC